ncbi:hypothetical protein EEL30_18585 [Brevibacillus laterosporus]|uniref:Sporulation membrane protein YtaF n=1 Tax=Brevibacillus laterosporus TaxID=1465 RepID=A0A518VAU4_BRELA|nr:hypothetical protein EEL30_18585 [Brevibacillus laterosporus]
MKSLFIVGLALSSSLEHLGATSSYGIGQIDISVLFTIWITLVCFLVSLGSIYFGQLVLLVFTGFLLSVIVIQIILLAIDRKNVAVHENIFLKQLTNITKNLKCFDFIQSGQMGVAKVIILLIGLTVHALMIGVRTGFRDLPSLSISLTASLSSFFTLWMSIALGSKVTKIKICSFHLGKFGTLISGAIIIVSAFQALM